jgi:SPX domain protein involved in polyphosphate accumulation
VSDYSVIEIKNKRQHHYQSEYFDTANKTFYLDHHNGRKNRYKIRTRYYTDSQLGFFELKHKNNKGRTQKSRIPYPYAYGPLTNTALNFIDKKAIETGHLEAVLRIEYDRFTLVNQQRTERVTIDSNICFIKGEHTTRLNQLVIAEVKQPEKGNSHFINVMKSKGIREGSLSKYCMGMALSEQDLKQNNFREKLRTLKKICY